MWSQRRVVDCGPAKRAAVHSGRSGRTSPGGVCDPQPYLLRAARHVGEQTDRHCPVCQGKNVTNVTHVHGDPPGSHADQAKLMSESADMAHDYDEFRVHLVEVCQGCSWNHLTVSFVLGNGPPALVSPQ